MASPPLATRRSPLASIVSPLASWFADAAAARRFRRERLGRRAALLRPRDAAWRGVVPGFGECVEMVRGGVPFQVAAEGRYDRSGTLRALARALRTGSTVYLPQVHQVLPRLMRLIAALRGLGLGPAAEECSFLFLVEGTGRPGMGLHHDGDVDALWLQFAGRRTVTLGPRVPPGTPEDLDDRVAAGGARAGWRTLDLPPGSLLYLPPRTPHAVVCRGRSLAATLTWRRTGVPERAGAGPGAAAALARWDVVSGFAEPVPARRPGLLWTQLPVVPGPGRSAGGVRVWTADGAGPRLPARARPALARLAAMPRLPRRVAEACGLGPLIEAGLLAPHDLPRRIRPDDPGALDGWRF